METFYKNKKTADYFNGFCGERGKPDLILPKYVRNDITLSM